LNEDRINVKTADQKYCTECGELIRLRAEICPKCGCRQLTPQPTLQPAFSYKPDPVVGPMILLFIGNVLWSGLGNLMIGDQRGWAYGFLTWIFFVLSWFTLGLPCVLFFAYCGWQGYEFLRGREHSLAAQQA
jgi:ribosomal protein L40E